MSTKDDGGPAFPAAIAVGPAGDLYNSWNDGFGGMTLRQWFAGQALAGMLSSDTATAAIMAQAEAGPDSPFEVSARMAYQFSDAMIAESKK